jgi:hypothetical protein
MDIVWDFTDGVVSQRAAIMNATVSPSDVVTSGIMATMKA